MNNMKFIARYMALGAILTGVSSQAIAQSCPLNVSCPNGGTLATATSSDQWGEDFIPDVGQVNLSVDKFDKAFYANFHSVPEAEIALLGVEVTLSVEVNEMQWNLTNILTPCTFDWSWPVQITIQQNTDVLTPEIQTPLIQVSDNVTLNPGDTYSWDLLVDGDGVQQASECFGTVNNLAPWIVNGGNSQVTWDVDLVAFPSQTGCSNASQQRQVRGIVTVEVKYSYCFGTGGDDPEGCVCDRPSPNYRRPGSLLLFPEFDTRPGEYTVITVTNVDCVQNSGENVDIEFVFIDEDGCTENNKTETLTPCDTLTFLAGQLNPNPERGYLYVFAKEYNGGAPNGTPISWNYLVGNEMIISGFDFFDYSMNPVSFRSNQADGDSTDLDGDGYRDLDSQEYEPAPNIITIPRYFGQDGVQGDEGLFNSQLILIGLSGGQRFDTTACILYYNDNEQVFSTDWTFRCWDKPYLLDINFGFGNGWLANNTNDDPDEIFGAETRESGWICIEGCAASSDQEDIENPAIYAALVEHVGALGIADLPFECGIRTNGTLLARGQFGDPDVDTNGDGVINDDDAVDGDNQ